MCVSPGSHIAAFCSGVNDDVHSSSSVTIYKALLISWILHIGFGFLSIGLCVLSTVFAALLDIDDLAEVVEALALAFFDVFA
jgi:hypothetical protein